MNIPELIPYICLSCGKTYFVLKSSRVWCPKCHKWVNQDTGTSSSKPLKKEKIDLTVFSGLERKENL
jgi:transposase-like protein